LDLGGLNSFWHSRGAVTETLTWGRFRLAIRLETSAPAKNRISPKSSDCEKIPTLKSTSHGNIHIARHEDYVEGYPTGAYIAGISRHSFESHAAATTHSDPCRVSNQQNQKYGRERPPEAFESAWLNILDFYTRKVKFTQETFTEKLSLILDGFPRLQDIHPFHKDLLNTLYDADHFRIALGQLSTAKHLIEIVSRDYVRLLKYAQSLFQCKQLKRAALGRMATICRRLKDPLLYLDQVRQHLGRLPSIDPNTRTLLICGYPNVGKSSFLKSVTRADVDVQPYAFTTKSLFVGHFDYKYLRFQAIDTPGILDHPLEEMNTIEMQSITAIAHLRSAILYFMDLSEQCGYTVQAQMQLFQSIKPLFANKLVFIVINKIDVVRPEDLDEQTQAQLQALLKPGDVELLQLSCTTSEGVQEVKNAACERLIADRVAQKLKAGTNSSGTVGSRLGDVLARIHVARPMDGIVREAFIPEAVKQMKKYDKNDPERRMLARDIEEEQGGAGVYNVDLKEKYILENPEWKHDKIPEVFDGKNVYDFIDPDIEQKLAALEEEEEKLEAEGFYDSDEELEDAEDAEMRLKADLIREKRQLIRNEAKMRKSLKNRAVIPRSATRKKLTDMEDHLDALGLDTTSIGARARSQSRGRSAVRSRTGTQDIMDVDDPGYEAKMRAKSRARSQSNRRDDGVTNEVARSKAERAQKLSQRRMNRMARQGEADRHVAAAMPKHLVGSLITHPSHGVANRCSSLASGVWERRTAVRYIRIFAVVLFLEWSLGGKRYLFFTHVQAWVALPLRLQDGSLFAYVRHQRMINSGPGFISSRSTLKINKLCAVLRAPQCISTKNRVEFS
jgi:nucleolar GTP-binding protein